MRLDLSVLWSWNRTLARMPYLITGLVLFSIKFTLDWIVATQFFQQTWSPLNYLIWPNDRTIRIFDLTDPDRGFLLTMLGLSLPFIWIGVMLTLHRLRDAGLPLGLILFFFVPLVNLLFILVLVLLPSRPEPIAQLQEPAPVREGPQFIQMRKFHRKITIDSHWRSGLVALLVTVPLTILAIVVGANVFQSYGFSLFLGAPFALGMLSVLLFGFSRPQPFWSCLVVAWSSAAAVGVALLLLAMEGAICLIMAAPIVGFLSTFGAIVGYFIQARPWLGDHFLGILLAMILMLPALMAAEAWHEPSPMLRPVRTSIVVQAPPATVWRHVLSFPPLPEPEEWLFRCGVAYPLRAEIHGQGVGAVRHCIFTTGTFVEPIEVWEAPSLLRFRVQEQPEPMRELSPYHIHPPHLDHYLVSQQGQFLLEPLPDGRTRLEGTTWYTNRMWPQWYWHLWADHIIHRIHLRVLRHVQELAEADVSKP